MLMVAVNSDETHQASSYPTVLETSKVTTCVDSFDIYNFPEFTEQEFAQIDAIFNTYTGASKIDSLPESVNDDSSTKPRIAVEIEEGDPLVAKTTSIGVRRPEPTTQLSPYNRYRHRKTLSVSDLTAPAWCELQFDYGLRQKRHRKLQDRPDSFVSGQGKTIVVARDTAEHNERTLESGRNIHERLEREIRPEKTYVTATSIEEIWGLRLLNMSECVQDLINIGLCREMPVFGVVHDHVVFGVIDEISRKHAPRESGERGIKRLLTSAPSTPRKPKRTRSDQSLASRDFQALCAQARDTAPVTTTSSLAPSYVLQLFDSKTRRSKSLPSDRDTNPARLQLTLYHRLLQGLVHSSSKEALDMSGFWSRVDANPLKPFSRQFCDQSGLPQRTEAADEQHPGNTWCLNDLVDIWQDLVSALDVIGVDSSLTLVYRTQKLYKAKKSSSPTGARRSHIHSAGQSTEEEIQIAQAIEASLFDVGIEDDTLLAQAVAESLQKVQTLDSSVPGTNEVGTVDAGALNDPSPKPVSTGLARQEANTDDSADGNSRIIGVKTFDVDEGLLESHLDRVLDWWHGFRPPQGVEIEDSGRCRSCEYRDGCEWRNSKAQDALAKARSPSGQ